MDIRRGSTRFAERGDGRLTHHGFSFGRHYDPERLAFGPMVCHDDHLLGSGRGFEEHAHQGLEIVTWVVSGAVRHTDSLGGTAVLGPGDCGVLSAGSGVRHSEVATREGPARFVQVWLTPADPTLAPSYSSTSVAPQLTGASGTGLVRVVGPGGSLSVDVPGASLDVVRLGIGEAVEIPGAPKVHVFVATGALLRSSLAEPMAAGDAFLMSDEGPHTLAAAVPSELLVWSFT